VGLSLTAVLVAAAVEEAEDDVVREVARVLTEDTPGTVAFDTRGGRHVQLTVATVRSQVGQPAGVYAVLRDTTDQHRYEQIVRQSQKLESVGVLAAGVAHEVNNPLAFIQANLGSLQQMADAVERNLHRLPEKDADELADLREVLDDSLEGITRISRIVNRLRRFSRTPEARSGPVDPNAVVVEAVRFARLDRQGGFEMTTDLEPGLPPVRGSRDGLTQVLLNLLMNAAQAVAGRPDGRVEIETRRDGDGVRITVRDNGPGVPEPIRRHIFDPFFTTKPPDEGTGLGLAIAFDIAREHGGRLELRDEAGPGACFRLHLPAASPQAESEAA
jgi:two-component system sensor histidine kinase HupT/HoxJ